jgi:S1-C subfamily serine protease
VWDASKGTPGGSSATLPYLGVYYKEERPTSGREGVFQYAPAEILGVQPDTPAEVVGLRPGDRILAIDGKPLIRHRTLRDVVWDGEVGGTITLLIDRDGERLSLPVTLAALPVPPE